MAETAALIATAVMTAAPYVAAAGTLATVGLTIAQSQQAGAAASAQATMARAQVAQQANMVEAERLKGREQANQVRDRLVRTVAAQNARYGASGLAMGMGDTPDAVTAATIAEGERQLTIVDTNTDIRVAGARIGAAQSLARATMLDDDADTIGTAGYLRAGTQLLSGFGSWAQRQPSTTPTRSPREPALSADSNEWTLW